MKPCICAVALLAILGVAQSQTFATVQDAVAALPELSMLNKNTDAIPLSNQLRDPNFVGTLFAPTNAVLEGLEEAVGGDLTSALGDPEQVNDVFSTAVIPGKALTLDDLKDGMKLTTLNGNTVTVKVTQTNAGKVYQINKAYITKANIKAGNSIIHEVSSIVVPTEYQEMLDALLPADANVAKPPVIASDSAATTTPTTPTPTTSTTTTPNMPSNPTTTTTTTTKAPSTTNTPTTSATQSAAGGVAVGAALLAVPALLAMLL